MAENTLDKAAIKRAKEAEKIRDGRGSLLPDAIRDLVTLPASRNYDSFRDGQLYPLLTGESYESLKWPDLPYGSHDQDLIRINVYTTDGSYIDTVYKSHTEFTTYKVDDKGVHLDLDTGKIVRDLGFRRGRFKLEFDFFRVLAGSPFPVLVNDRERIFSGEFDFDSNSGIISSTTSDIKSDTGEGERLYVKDNKYLITSISADRTELILSPAFINDEKYLEDFRLAGYNCFNWFPPDGVSLSFPNPGQQFIQIVAETDEAQQFIDENKTSFKKWINGTVRVNNAYYVGTEEIPEDRRQIEIEPDIESVEVKQNLLQGRFLDDLYGWRSHGVWGNVPDDSPVFQTSEPNPFNRGLVLEPVVEDNPTGKTCVKAIVQNYINPAAVENGPHSLGSLARTNYTIYAIFDLPPGTGITGITKTFSVYVKGVEGSSVRLLAHSGPWISGAGNTVYSDILIADGSWQRLDMTYALSGPVDDALQLRIIFDPSIVLDVTSPSVVGTEFLVAGASLTLGSEVVPFTRQMEPTEKFMDVATAGTIKFEDPDSNILVANFPENSLDVFTEKMVGGQIRINGSIAIDDIDNTAQVNEVTTESIFDEMLVASSEEGSSLAEIGWDNKLHGKAIKVTDVAGNPIFGDGYRNYSKSYKGYYANTSDIGYHAMWLDGKGVNGGPAMFFPDINNQDYILDKLKARAIENLQDPENYYLKQSPTVEDPRTVDFIENNDEFAHRYMSIQTNDGVLPTFASLGGMVGDTVRVSWMQKSAPLEFDQGLRKGAKVGLYHYFREFYGYPPQDEPTITSAYVGLVDRAVISAEFGGEKILGPDGITRYFYYSPDFRNSMAGPPSIGTTSPPDYNAIFRYAQAATTDNDFDRYQNQRPSAPPDGYLAGGRPDGDLFNVGPNELRTTFIKVVGPTSKKAIVERLYKVGYRFGTSNPPIATIVSTLNNHTSNILNMSGKDALNLPEDTPDQINVFQYSYKLFRDKLGGRQEQGDDREYGSTSTYEIKYQIQWKLTDAFQQYVSGKVWEFDPTNGTFEYVGPVLPSNLLEGTVVPAKLYTTIGSDTSYNPNAEIVRGANELPITVDSNSFGWVWNGYSWVAFYNSQYNEFIQSENLNVARSFSNALYGKVGEPIVGHDQARIVGDGFGNVTSDLKWLWDGQQWYPNYESEEVTAAESLIPRPDGGFDTITRTFKLFSLDSTEERNICREVFGDRNEGAFVTRKGIDFNEWELQVFEFELNENYALDLEHKVAVYGHYGDHGILYVDQLKVDIVKNSEIRTVIDTTAVLSSGMWSIEEVISPTKIRVDKTYEEKATDMNSIVSTYQVNKYSTFDKGFLIDYVEEPAGEEDIFARYEGTVVDLQEEQLPDGSTSTFIVVDKSYNQKASDLNIDITVDKAVMNVQENPLFDEYFIRHKLNDPNHLYTMLICHNNMKNLIINFKPVDVANYPGSIAYKLMEPLDPNVEQLEYAYLAHEVTPSLSETIDLVPFIDEKIPETVLRVPGINDTTSPIRSRETDYKSHTDLVGVKSDVRLSLEDRLLSGSLETVAINVDYRQYKNFVHFGSAEKRIINFKTKLQNIELYVANSSSLSGDASAGSYITGQSTASIVSGSQDFAKQWEDKKREIINGFDDFENYMYFQSSSFISSSNGIFYDNASPKRSGDGSLTSPYVLYSVSSSQFTKWFASASATASAYDKENVNRLVNLLPAHIKYDNENSEFLTFMDMIGHHYDNIWTHIKAMTDVHDRSEDVTTGISATLVKPVAESLGFQINEGRDLVSLPQYHLGLAESGSNTGVYNVRYTKRSQKDLTREIWNRILATSPYMLKAKGTKQSLKSLIAAYGIPTSILRIQEYGGPRNTKGEPDFEITKRFTKAVNFDGTNNNITVPWYHGSEFPLSTRRASDTLEFRFKAKSDVNQWLAVKNVSTGYNPDMGVFITSGSSGGDGTGTIGFFISGSLGPVTMSISDKSIQNQEFWSLMIRRRQASISSSFPEQTIDFSTSSSQLPVTQSVDMFLSYYEASIDDITVKASASLDISGSMISAWEATGSNRYWYIGGYPGNNQTTLGNGDKIGGLNFSGSLMEWRYWYTPLSESVFYNHVAAPKAVNGNHPSSSYYDLNLRLSFDDNTNLNSSPNTVKDYTLTGDQTVATASNFPNKVSFGDVADRQKAFVPLLGSQKQSNKIRIETSKLKGADGTVANLSPTERVEISSGDTAGIDSNKLGIFFAPTDVINEDIIMSVADLNFGSYLGDPRDTYNDRYIHGNLDRITDEYWRKWTTKFRFWDYIKLIKYYDLSLFDHLRSLAPARAKKNLGILIEPTLLERPKVVVGKPPIMTDERKEAIYKLKSDYEPTGSQRTREAIIPRSTPADISGSRRGYNATVTASNEALIGSFNRRYVGALSGSFGADRAIFSSEDKVKIGSTFITASAILSDRNDFESTVVGEGVIKKSGVIQRFGKDFRLEVEDRIEDAKVYTNGGSNIFFEVEQPMVTGSRTATYNQDRIFFYSSSLSASNYMPYSSSLEPSEFESIFTSRTGLSRLAYEGCKEDGSTIPFGNQSPVDIIETNPYDVTTSTEGDSYVEVDLTSE